MLTSSPGSLIFSAHVRKGMRLLIIVTLIFLIIINFFHYSLLERGRMFVLSKRQLSRLIPHSILPQTPPLLLDIGSGDGHVTDNLRQALSCTSVHVTEASMVMQRVLQKKGFRYNIMYSSDFCRMLIYIVPKFLSPGQ